MIALVDYGIGNLFSVAKALVAAGGEVETTSSPETIQAADKVVLPGVGAFGDGMEGLAKRGLVDVVKEVVERDTPMLGICVGMQLLFEESEENGPCAGLGLLPGRVRRFKGLGLKVPQTGWNQILPTRPSPIYRNLRAGAYAYFNHSYYCEATAADTLAQSEYGILFSSIVGREHLFGVQFHPEKSQDVGLRILRNFVELA